MIFLRENLPFLAEIPNWISYVKIFLDNFSVPESIFILKSSLLYCCSIKLLPKVTGNNLRNGLMVCQNTCFFYLQLPVGFLPLRFQFKAYFSKHSFVTIFNFVLYLEDLILRKGHIVQKVKVSSTVNLIISAKTVLWM